MSFENVETKLDLKMIKVIACPQPFRERRRILVMAFQLSP